MRRVSRAPRPASSPPGRTDGVDERVEHHAGLIPRRQQFVAVLAGVAGAAHPHRDTAEFGVDVAHVVHVGRQPQRTEHVGRLRPLHREHGVGPVLVGDRQPGGGALGQRGDDGGGVGRVGHQEDLVVGDVVGDQVVDDPAGVGAAQRVLRLARPDATQVVGQCGVDVVGRAGAAHQRLAEVADVEKPDGVARRGVLGDRARVRDRHQPAAELGEAGAELAMTFLEGALLGLRSRRPHGIHPNRLVDAGRLGCVVDFDALEAAGIADARGRAGLIEYLDKLGFTAEEMVDAERRGRLFGLAGDALQGPGRPIHSLRTAAEALGVIARRGGDTPGR